MNGRMAPPPPRKIRVVCDSHTVPHVIATMRRRPLGGWYAEQLTPLQLRRWQSAPGTEGSLAPHRQAEYDRVVQLAREQGVTLEAAFEIAEVRGDVERIRQSAVGPILDARLTDETDSERVSHPLRCDLCNGNAQRRSERLAPILDLLADAGAEQVTLRALQEAYERFDSRNAGD